MQACVDCELRVPRGKPGDLVDGVTAVLERIPDVRDAEVREVERVHPTPFDLTVTGRVDVTMAAACDDPAVVQETLEDGFGVIDVGVVALTPEEVDR